MKKLTTLFALAFFATAIPVLHMGCGSHTITLEQGGVYSDAELATIDQGILDASRTMTGFINWYGANKVFLDGRVASINQFVANISLQKDGWIRDAYRARDAYAEDRAAWKRGLLTGPPDKAKLNATLELIKSITSQIATYKAQNP